MAAGAGFVDDIIKKVGGVGKKILSNLSVDGGIEGLSKQSMGVIAKTSGDVSAVMEKAMKDTMGKGGVVPEKFANVAKKFAVQRDAFHTNKGMTDANGGSYFQASKNAYEDMGHTRSAGLNAAKDVAIQYYTGGNKAQKLTRAGVTLGGYAGVNVAGRALNGGSLTQNNKGERDIAGIPIF